MRFAVDAHAIGRHLTGNEVYVRSLLNAFAAQGQDDEFIAYVSAESAALSIPANIQTRRIATNPFMRLGLDLAMQVRRDRPDLLHVQYTAPLACPVPVVVSVHDVSFLEHPEYFTPISLLAAITLTSTVSGRMAARSRSRSSNPSRPGARMDASVPDCCSRRMGSSTARCSVAMVT